MTNAEARAITAEDERNLAIKQMMRATDHAAKLEAAAADADKFLDRALWQEERLGPNLHGVNWQAVVGLMRGEVLRAKEALRHPATELDSLSHGQGGRFTLSISARWRSAPDT